MIGAVITDEREAQYLLPWLRFYGEAFESAVIIYCVTEHGLSEDRIEEYSLGEAAASDKPLLNSTAKAFQEAGSFHFDAKIVRIKAQSLAELLVQQVEGCKKLLIAKESKSKDELSTQLAESLIPRFQGELLLFRVGDQEVRVEDSTIVIPVSGGPHAITALQHGVKLVEKYGGEVVPVYIQTQIGEFAVEVGERQLQKILKQAGVSERECIRPRVVLSENIKDGIVRVVEQEKCTLVFIGASEVSGVRKLLFKTIPDHFLEGSDATNIAVIRSAFTLVKRSKLLLEYWLDLTVPQLEREDRIALYENLQKGSNWNFDFLALIGLSTAIAAFGLLQNSAAVVIGAMLVAPLMMPLLGSGLALIQGNLPLAKSSSKSIGLGFLSALMIGVVIGYIVPTAQLTEELLARGSPNLLDLFVAILSGIAAAYCVGRPTLSAALPGVAIAAALVPPIATTGIAIAIHEWEIARGAATLFGTNVVAIVLGAAMSFYAGGVRARSGDEEGARWVRRTFSTLLIFTIALSIPLGLSLYSRFQIWHGALDFTQANQRFIRQLIAESDQHTLREIQFLQRKGEPSIQLFVESKEPIGSAEVERIGKKLKERLKTSFSLEIRTILRNRQDFTEDH